MTHRTASFIGGLGRTLIGLGLIVLSFAAFQLWGTGFLEAQAQGDLADDWSAKLAEFEALEASVDPAATAAPATEDETGDNGDPDLDGDAVGDDPETELDGSDDPVITNDEPTARPVAIPSPVDELIVPDPGEVLGTIEIPDIGLERNIIAGVRRDDLRKGPGHYPETPLPGQAGNVAIAGHRTTYGQPFHDLDLLEPGDLITVTTLQGEHFYEVMPQEDENGETVGHFIVSPSQVEVLEDFGDNRLTLTACHPKRSSRLRIIVTAELVSPPQETTALPAVRYTAEDEEPDEEDDTTEIIAADDIEEEPEFAIDDSNAVGIDEDALQDSLGWNTEEMRPTLLWGGAATVIVLAALVLGHLWRKRLSYALSAPLFLFTLFYCFVHLDRLLPAL